MLKRTTKYTTKGNVLIPKTFKKRMPKVQVFAGWIVFLFVLFLMLAILNSLNSHG